MFARALLVSLLIAGSAFAGPRGKLVKADQVAWGTNILSDVLVTFTNDIDLTGISISNTQYAIALGNVNTSLTVAAQDLANLEAYLLGGDVLSYGLVPSVETQVVAGVGYVITNYTLISTGTNSWSANGAATNAALVPALQYNQNITTTNFSLVNTNTYVTTNLFNIVGQSLGLTGTNLSNYVDWINSYQTMDLGYTTLPTNLQFTFPSITAVLDASVSNLQVSVTNTVEDVNSLQSVVTFGNLQGAQLTYTNATSVIVEPLAGFVTTNFFSLTNETYTLEGVPAADGQQYIYVHEDSPFPVGLVTNSATVPSLDVTYGGYYAAGVGRAIGCVNINASGNIDNFFSNRDGWKMFSSVSAQCVLETNAPSSTAWFIPAVEDGTNFFSVAATEARILAFTKVGSGATPGAAYALWFGAVEGTTTNFVSASQQEADPTGYMYLSAPGTIPLGPSKRIGLRYTPNYPNAVYIRADGFKEVW